MRNGIPRDFKESGGDTMRIIKKTVAKIYDLIILTLRGLALCPSGPF